MIKIADSFFTDNKKLSALYDSAKSLVIGSVKPFGEYRLAVMGNGVDRVSLESEIMTAETLARYDIAAALDTIKAFILTQREDGRLASSIVKTEEGIFSDYSKLDRLSFAEEVLSVYYMTKRKELSFLDSLYASLERFDDYLQSTHDKNFNGCPELGEAETSEGRRAGRYAPVKIFDHGRETEISPFPIEPAALTAFSYRLKKTLADISRLVGDGKSALYKEEADRIFDSMRNFFWDGGKLAYFDRDLKGRLMPALTLDNLMTVYYGAAEKELSDALMTRHILNPEEFYTKLPLPTVALNDGAFEKNEARPYGGLVRGDYLRRAVRAFRKGGFYAELVDLSTRVLDAVYEAEGFPSLFDPESAKAVKQGEEYIPTASAVIEMIAGMYGVSVIFDEVHWGALGHNDECSSEYSFTWGGDRYSVLAEKDTTTGLLNGKLVFTVTNGVRVITDWFGDSPRVVNVTDKDIDCVFVYRDKTYSFTISPNKVMSF